MTSGTLFKLTGIIDIQDNSAVTKMKSVEQQSDKTSTALKKNNSSSGKASSGLAGLSKSLSSAKAAFAVVTLAITIATKALQEYGRVQTEVAQLGTLFVGNTKDANKLADASKKLAKDLGIDEVQALSAAYKVASTQLGSTEKEMESATETALKLARVGRAVGDSLDVSGVVNLLSTEIRSFGMNASDASKVSDELFKTIQLGNTDINQLASSLPQVSAVAANAGVSFKELLAIIAGASKVIPDNTQITSSLTTALAQLQNGSAGVGKKFESLFGTTFKDALSQTGSLTNLLVEFDNRLKESGSSLAQAFGVRGLKGITAIVKVADDINKSMGQIGDSTGLVDQGIKQVGEQGGLSFGQLKTSFESMIAQLGEGLAPIIPTLTELFSDFGKVLKPIASIISKVLTPIMNIITPIIDTLSDVMTTFFDALSPVFDLLTDVGDILSTIILPVMDSIKIVMGVINTILKALKPILTVVGYILKGIGFVIKGIVWLAAKAIDLITKVLTLGFGGTHFADGIFKNDNANLDKGDDLLNKGGASQKQIESANTQGQAAATSAGLSPALLGKGKGSGSTTVVNQSNTFTQPKASLSDIARQQRDATRKAVSDMS